MGTIDRILRIALAVVVGALYLTGVINGTVAMVLLVFAAIFIVTSLVGSCPLYLPLGISTRKKA